MGKKWFNCRGDNSVARNGLFAVDYLGKILLLIFFKICILLIRYQFNFGLNIKLIDQLFQE